MKESQPIPEIAVSLATSLVAAPYLLIRNYYHKKVAPVSKLLTYFNYIMTKKFQHYMLFHIVFIYSHN